MLHFYGMGALKEGCFYSFDWVACSKQCSSKTDSTKVRKKRVLRSTYTSLQHFLISHSLPSLSQMSQDISILQVWLNICCLLIRQKPSNIFFNFNMRQGRFCVAIQILGKWSHLCQVCMWISLDNVCNRRYFISWVCLHGPVIQANGRLTFKDDLRSGGLLRFISMNASVHTELADSMVIPGEPGGD